MTKQEAAAYLGISERSVENWRDKGHLTQTLVPGKTRPIAIYDDTEVETLRQYLETRKSESRKSNIQSRMSNIEQEPSTTSNVENRITPISRISNIEKSNPEKSNVQIYAFDKEQFESLIQQSRAEVSLDKKLLLTIPEAMTLSGIKEKPIRDAIKTGALNSIRIGRSIQVRPEDLKLWVDSQFPK
jgi:hypothetical protein